MRRRKKTLPRPPGRWTLPPPSRPRPSRPQPNRWGPDGKTIAWGNRNFHGKNGLHTLQQTFSLADLEFGETLSTDETPKEEALRAGPDFRRDNHAAGAWSLERVDLFAIAIKQNGRQVGIFRSSFESDRVYSFSLLPGDRAVFGSSFGLFLVDLNTRKRLRSFRGSMVLGVAPSPDGKYFLTGGIDETVRIWSPDRDEPLLSLFVAGQDWIAWTPEGYYAASAYGERLMGWQVNQGPDHLGTCFPAGRFRASLYNPELIKLILPEGGTKPALARVGKGDKPTVNVAEVLPPVAIVSSPLPGKLDKARQEVKGVARSVGTNPVTAMRLLVDGRPWQGDRGVIPSPVAKRLSPLALVLGGEGLGVRGQPLFDRRQYNGWKTGLAAALAVYRMASCRPTLRSPGLSFRHGNVRSLVEIEMSAGQSLPLPRWRRPPGAKLRRVWGAEPPGPSPPA